VNVNETVVCRHHSTGHAGHITRGRKEGERREGAGRKEETGRRGEETGRRREEGGRSEGEKKE